MRILSVIDAFAHGGAETVLVDLVLGLHEHQHHVVHFSAANGIPAHQPFVTALGRRGIGVSDVHWSCFAEPDGWADVLDRVRPDVVLCHWWGNHPWQPWIGRVASAPPGRRPTFVLVLHHAGIPAPGGYDRYVLVTEAQRLQVARARPDCVRVIPNGVDLRRFRPRSNGHTSRHMVVGRLSSMREGKIAADLVDELAAFDVPRTRYVLAGDGALRPVLAERTEALGLADRIALPGYVPRERVPDMLGGLDVFCYRTSTAAECHPLSFLEALAAGVPIVAEARGGVAGIVRHGENGLLATSSDGIGAHLHRLRRDDGLRTRLGRGARASAHGYALPRQVGAYRSLLREIDEERAQVKGGAWQE